MANEYFFSQRRFVEGGGTKRPRQWRGSDADGVGGEYFLPHGDSLELAAQSDRGDGEGAAPDGTGDRGVVVAERWAQILMQST